MMINTYESQQQKFLLRLYLDISIIKIFKWRHLFQWVFLSWKKMFFPLKEALDSPSRESDKHANVIVFYQIPILRVQCSFAWYWDFLVRYQSFISSYLSFVGTEFALFVVCVALLMLWRTWGWGWKEIWVKERGEAWERKRRERKGRTGKEKEDSEKGEKGEGIWGKEQDLQKKVWRGKAFITEHLQWLDSWYALKKSVPVT